MKSLLLIWFRICLLTAVILALALFPTGAAAAPLHQEDDPQAQADALYGEGVTLFQAGQLEAALQRFEAAVPLYQAASDREGEAVCLLYLGSVRHRLADYPGALNAYEASLPIWREIDSRVGEGVTLNNIGVVYDDLGQYEKALEVYQQALAIAQAIPDRESEGTRLNNIGAVYRNLGQYKEALDYYQQALAICQEIDDPAAEGTTLSNIGSVYADLGQYAQALEYLHQALVTAQQINDRPREGTRLNNIGSVYADLGQYAQALDYYQQALAIAQAINDPAMEGALLDNIGGVYYDLARYEQALDYYQQALAMRQEIDDRAGEGTTLNNIGLIHADLGQYAQALDYCQQALAIAQEINDQAGEGMTHNNIGAVYESLGQYQQALNYYKQGLAILQKVGERAGEGTTLGNIGVLHESLEQYEQATTFYRQAIDVIESIQGDIGVEDLKASFAGGQQQVSTYERLIKLLWREGQLEDAFSYVERARARAFLDQMGNQQVDFRRGAAPELISEEQVLRQQIIGLQNALSAERTKPIDQQSQELLDTLSAELEKARNDHQELIIRLELASPEYASLVSVNVLSLEEVHSQVLDEQTTLVEYFVLAEQTLAWVIDRESLELVSLKVARDDLRSQVEFLRQLIARRDFDAPTVGQLYDTLFAPLKPHLRHANLLVVPHGVLHYLPFAALWDAENERYLAQDYALTYAPSASVLQFILDKRNADEGRLLALGNPDGSLPRAKTETEVVAELFGAMPLLGGQAVESQVHVQAGQLDVLHLAAHGVYNPFNPLFTRIELAPDGTHDGYLEVHEVFSLDLTGANLVVLSACETAMGEQSEGDELVGLTRAFLYAGTPSVVTTLWSVDDAASGFLMESFYRHLRDGLTNAEALRAAQLEVLEQEEWQLPYFWAAFSLTGDYLGSGEPVGAVDQTLESTRRENGGGLCGGGVVPLGVVLVVGIGRIGNRRRIGR